MHTAQALEQKYISLREKKESDGLKAQSDLNAEKTNGRDLKEQAAPKIDRTAKNRSTQSDGLMAQSDLNDEKTNGRYLKDQAPPKIEQPNMETSKATSVTRRRTGGISRVRHRSK